MVINSILDYFQSAFMHGRYQFQVRCTAAHSSVYLIVVSEPISMVSAHHTGGFLLQSHIIFNNRCQPDRGCSKLLYIVEMVEHALQITTMTGERVFAICNCITHTCIMVIARIPIAETIGHQQVNE